MATDLSDGSGNWGQGAQGAAGGAMTGGSMGGGWGALLGGLVGGGIGMMTPDKKQQYNDQLAQLAAGYGARSSPQASGAAQAQYSGFRANQAGLISQLEAMARGEGPSAATIQMREAMDRAAGAQASAAAGAGGRGVNAGGAMRNAMNNTAAIQSQGARDTAQMRSQEQMAAIGQLGSNIQAGRGADEGVNMYNAGQQNQMAQANLQAQLSALGINTNAQLQALMAAMNAQGPGTGTQILAGGASAMPSILQYQQGQKQLAQQQAAQDQAAANKYNSGYESNDGSGWGQDF